MASSNVGEVAIELVASEQRIYGSEELGLLWRDATGPIPEAVAVDFSLTRWNTGSDVDVQLAGPDLDRLRAAAEDVKQRLREYAGVYEVTDSFRAGKEEMKLGIKPAAEALGLTLQDLGRQVRQAFYGEEAQRIQRGRDDIRVMVRYPRDERRSLGDLENMRIRTPDGGEVPFSQVAVVEPGRGFASIRRVDRNRAVNVTASVDPTETAAGDVIADLNARILPEVLTRYPDVFYTIEGGMAEQRDAVGGLQRGFVLALLMIFALLAVPLRSYVQPLIIMGAIPFGLIGAVWGHLFLDLHMSMMSMFGLVALNRRRGQRQPDHGRLHQPGPGRPHRRRADGAAGGRGPDGPAGVRVGRPRARGAGGRRPPLPAHPADVAHHLLGPRAADVEQELRRRLHGADGGLARLRRALRDVHHADPGANVLHDPRRLRADDAPDVRTPRAGAGAAGGDGGGARRERGPRRRGDILSRGDTRYGGQAAPSSRVSAELSGCLPQRPSTSAGRTGKPVPSSPRYIVGARNDRPPAIERAMPSAMSPWKCQGAPRMWTVASRAGTSTASSPTRRVRGILQ